MTIKYPNGNHYQPHLKSKISRPIIYGKRGMSLEDEVNKSNQYYLENQIAVVHKKPTPIRIVKVNYPKRSAAVIKEAYFDHASTTDYNGVYKGYYIDFDAKETKSLTAFPLRNFHKHQVEHMRQCVRQGGICFALIKFVKTNEIFVFKASDLFYFWDQQNHGGRKSIPKPIVEKLGYQIHYHFQPLIPYINAVNQIIQS
ncbi:Holliday junction resolvase RecU [Philodulcilactobacillus myokoensis]|uniref:Holliday junction resolvase RecU n=1 Tax=Philodulcilactobacillus myokoensis TaxID=2929573 RepID=A0A9W6B1K7_9LACO|nr:Holliday junction resolvase RecU [Philodulcilactobacillus myokoensis]GLB46845.1 Holliday junction resolvase RecU [Philodulcilactobacillus myokoensis]